MKTMTFGTLVKILKGARGVATSLVEASATIAVGTVLAGVAITGGIDALDKSKVEAARSDVSVIGQAVLNFYKDLSVFPMFKDGTKTGPEDEFFTFIESENGTYPSSDSADTWEIRTPLFYGADTGNLGHKPNVGHDTIEGHLARNQIQNGNAQSAYPLRGFLRADLNRGWSGPYMDRLPKSDPWGSKFMINVQEFSTKHIREVHAVAGQPLPRRVVIVLSAGPNRQVETPSEQPFENFQIFGDDIAYRIR